MNVSELGPMGEGANVLDSTTVTYVGEKKEEEVKKELVDATEEKKEEKKDGEKDVEEDEKEEEKEEAKEDTPLQEDEDNLSK